MFCCKLFSIRSSPKSGQLWANEEGDERQSPSPLFCLTSPTGLTVGSGLGHDRRNLRKDGADAVGNARHDCTGRDSNEPCHQSVLDEVLTFCILPNLQL